MLENHEDRLGKIQQIEHIEAIDANNKTLYGIAALRFMLPKIDGFLRENGRVPSCSSQIRSSTLNVAFNFYCIKEQGIYCKNQCQS